MVECPFCNFNLDFYSLRQRDEHANACLEKLEVESAPQAPVQTPVARQIPLGLEESGPKLEQSPEDLGPKLEQSPEPQLKFEKLKSEFKIEPGYEQKLAPEPEPQPVPSKRKAAASPPARKKRTPPFYKFLYFGDTRITVDAFNYGNLNVPAYYLTHFHSDHYGGLTKSWNHGPIYCTPSTARLCQLKLKVDPQYLRPLELHKEYEIDGIKVVLFDANHCPGAAVFLFNDSVLHTGDFRASEALVAQILQRTPSLSKLYLDTTYLDPARTFPDQADVVQICADYALQVQLEEPKQRFLIKPGPRRVLAVVGTYTIGKERLAIKIAQKLGSKIWANGPKLDILRACDDPELEGLLSTDKSCQVHLVPMRDIRIDSLVAQWKTLGRSFTHLVAFSPTGWTWSSKSPFCAELMAGRATKRDNIQVCRVPYSEHSSFSELEAFCRRVKAKKIIATVGSKYTTLLKTWEV